MTFPVAAADVADFGPMAERAVSADAAGLIRLRSGAGVISGFVRLPYDVLAGRTVVAGEPAAFDVTLSAAEFVGWLTDPALVPTRQDAQWLMPLPPRSGWQRIETVPDTAVREVVRSGALLARDATSRSTQEALLGAVVLTVSSGARSVEVPLGPLSALTRMGFLPRGGSAAVDVAPGWIRVAAEYGSAYVNDGNALGLLSF